MNGQLTRAWTTGLQSLDHRREEKTLIVSEKLKRLPSHPAHALLTEHTKNRLKRSSINHLTKQLGRQHLDILPTTPEEQEPLQTAEEWDTHTEDMLFMCVRQG